MKYKEFEKFRSQTDFSKDNVSGCIIFLLCVMLVFMCGFYYQQSQKVESLQPYVQASQVNYAYAQHYKRVAEERQLIIDKYMAERIQIVDISFYTRSVRETDDTPNQTSIITFARPFFTVAVSHDLKWMLGHYIYIYGRGVFYVEDLMNERYTKRLDILVYSTDDIPDAGVLRNREVVVLGKDIELYYE